MCRFFLKNSAIICYLILTVWLLGSKKWGIFLQTSIETADIYMTFYDFVNFCVFRMGGIAGNLKDLAVQEEEHSALERDLEAQLVSLV